MRGDPDSSIGIGLTIWMTIRLTLTLGTFGQFPSAGLMVFPKTGHTINLEEPGLFNFALQDFSRR
jgi:pimeloyl-ACP methyl ester carboxylesterase